MEGLDSHLFRYNLYHYAENRSVGKQQYYVTGWDTTTSTPIASLTGHLGRIEDYKDVSAEVLLMIGSKSRDVFKDTLDALEKVLPHSNRIELESLDHGSAQDYGKPVIIAQELKSFFR